MGDSGDLPNHYLLNPILSDMLRLVKQHQVLDLGCGSGRWTKILAQKYDQITGIDNSLNMLKIAQEKRSAPNIVYKKVNVEELLPFADESFNFIFSNMVMHYLADIETIAKELYRILKPNCLLLFSTQHPRFDIARYNSLKDIPNRFKFQTRFLKGKVILTRFYEPLSLFITHFTKAGFILEAQKEAVITAEFAKIYPKYGKYIGYPRFVVFKFSKPT